MFSLAVETSLVVIPKTMPVQTPTTESHYRLKFNTRAIVVTRLREYDSIKYPKTVYTILSIEYWPSTCLITYPARKIMIIICLSVN